jgi:hypothetical protein
MLNNDAKQGPENRTSLNPALNTYKLVADRVNRTQIQREITLVSEHRDSRQKGFLKGPLDLLAINF